MTFLEGNQQLLEQIWAFSQVLSGAKAVSWQGPDTQWGHEQLLTRHSGVGLPMSVATCSSFPTPALQEGTPEFTSASMIRGAGHRCVGHLSNSRWRLGLVAFPDPERQASLRSSFACAWQLFVTLLLTQKCCH